MRIVPLVLAFSTTLLLAACQSGGDQNAQTADDTDVSATQESVATIEAEPVEIVPPVPAEPPVRDQPVIIAFDENGVSVELDPVGDGASAPTEPEPVDGGEAPLDLTAADPVPTEVAAPAEAPSQPEPQQITLEDVGEMDAKEVVDMVTQITQNPSNISIGQDGLSLNIGGNDNGGGNNGNGSQNSGGADNNSNARVANAPTAPVVDEIRLRDYEAFCHLMAEDRTFVYDDKSTWRFLFLSNINKPKQARMSIDGTEWDLVMTSDYDRNADLLSKDIPTTYEVKDGAAPYKVTIRVNTSEASYENVDLTGVIRVTNGEEVARIPFHGWCGV